MNSRSLRHAAKETVLALRRTGERAFYLYPDKTRRYFGYSYTIPKEEQIRSELYRNLNSSRENTPSFELEWNIYARRSPLRRSTARIGEIDLVGFDNGGIVAVLEVKRIWNLSGWLNKTSEFLRSIENDLGKLRAVASAITHFQATKPLTGVVVASFADSPERMRVLRRKLRHTFTSINALSSEDPLHVCAEHDDNGQINRHVFLRIDLIRS